MEEYVINSILDHNINRSRRDRYLKYGENLYWVLRYGFKRNKDMWELIKHLARLKVLIYSERKIIAIPDDINTADDCKTKQ